MNSIAQTLPTKQQMSTYTYEGIHHHICAGRPHGAASRSSLQHGCEPERLARAGTCRPSAAIPPSSSEQHACIDRSQPCCRAAASSSSFSRLLPPPASSSLGAWCPIASHSKQRTARISWQCCGSKEQSVEACGLPSRGASSTFSCHQILHTGIGSGSTWVHGQPPNWQDFLLTTRKRAANFMCMTLTRSRLLVQTGWCPVKYTVPYIHQAKETVTAQATSPS